MVDIEGKVEILYPQVSVQKAAKYYNFYTHVRQLNGFFYNSNRELDGLCSLFDLTETELLALTSMIANQNWPNFHQNLMFAKYRAAGLPAPEINTGRAARTTISPHATQNDLFNSCRTALIEEIINKGVADNNNVNNNQQNPNQNSRPITRIECINLFQRLRHYFLARIR